MPEILFSNISFPHHWADGVFWLFFVTLESKPVSWLVQRPRDRVAFDSADHNCSFMLVVPSPTKNLYYSELKNLQHFSKNLYKLILNYILLSRDIITLLYYTSDPVASLGKSGMWTRCYNSETSFYEYDIEG